jgi:hypothetical protein
MVHVYQFADSNFLLFHADQLADQTRAAVKRLNPTSVVIRRSDRIDASYYYLYTAKDFLEQLAEIESTRPLLDALQLHEAPATPTLDAYQDARSIPSRCVILEQDRLIGFYNVALPPKYAGQRRGQQDSAPKGPVFRKIQAELPEQVTMGETISLLVSLVYEANQQSALPIAVPIGAQVDFVVQTQRGFALDGSGEGSLAVTEAAETLPIQFKLRATELGQGQIRVLCFYGGQPLGAITLTSSVIAADQQARGKRMSSYQPLAPLAVMQPDLTLRIFEHQAYGRHTITWELLAQDPSLGLHFKSFGPIELRMDALAFFQQFFEEIEGLPIHSTEEQAIAMHKLERKGADLFQTLLPGDLQVLLWSLRERIESVQILSDEPWIPWELLRLQGRENGRVIEGLFFCEAFIITRWFPGIGRQPKLSLNRMATVIPSDSGLACAPVEQAYLRSLATDQRHVTEVPATYLDVMDALSRGEYDCWHFTGHGQFVAADPNRSAILLERGQRLRAEGICGRVSNCGLTRPLIFLNACQTGREALSLTGIGGWARRFVEAGAAGFIGSLWSVDDQAACQFAQTFYNHLLAGESIGQAVRTARAAIQSLKDPTWLAYTVFADPLAIVQNEAI